MILRNPAAAPGVSNSEAAYRTGLAALEKGGEAAAIPVLKAALTRDGNNARLWQVLALLHRAQEDLEPAVAGFRRAAQLAPRDPSIALGSAYALLEAGLPAVAAFEKAAALATNPLTVGQGLAASRVAEGRLGEAIGGLDDVLRAHPAWLEGHWLLARLRSMAGEEDAIASLRRALQAAPRDIGLWRHAIFILMHARQYEQALALAAEARAAAGDHPGLRIDEAACLTETWQIAEADRLYAQMPPATDVAAAIYAMRHALRSGRAEAAARRAEAFAFAPNGGLAIPYLALAWRLLEDERWRWLEGDERFVGVYDLGESGPQLDRLADRLRSVHAAAGQPMEQSVRGGTQTDGPLLSRIDPEVRALRAALVDAIERHIRQLPAPDPRHPLLVPRRDKPIRFAGSWSIRLRGQGHHVAHVHPAGWLSSAFYVALPGPEERGEGEAGWLALGAPPEELGLDLPPMRLVEPKPGRLVLFPSTMWHGTLPIRGGERLTVAFDVATPR
jgi:Flp pilus assembly protein TadD